MPQPTDQDDPITQAAYLARDIAPDLIPVPDTALGPIADRRRSAKRRMWNSTSWFRTSWPPGGPTFWTSQIRKLEEREGDEAGDELNWVLLVAAEGAAIGPSGWSELVALAVALPAGDVPDGEALGRGLIETGALLASEELRLLPGWRSPDALAELSFGAVRRVLLDMADGKPPRDLPPGDTDELARRGFGGVARPAHRLGHPGLGGDCRRRWPAGGVRRRCRGDAG